MFLFSIIYILNKTENAVGYFVLEENVPKDVKEKYWQVWPCVIRHMLRNTKTSCLSYFADLSLYKCTAMVRNYNASQCLISTITIHTNIIIIQVIAISLNIILIFCLFHF